MLKKRGFTPFLLGFFRFNALFPSFQTILCPRINQLFLTVFHDFIFAVTSLFQAILYFCADSIIQQPCTTSLYTISSPELQPGRQIAPQKSIKRLYRDTGKQSISFWEFCRCKNSPHLPACARIAAFIRQNDRQKQTEPLLQIQNRSRSRQHGKNSNFPR